MGSEMCIRDRFSVISELPALPQPHLVRIGGTDPLERPESVDTASHARGGDLPAHERLPATDRHAVGGKSRGLAHRRKGVSQV